MKVIEGEGPAPYFVYPLIAGLPDTSMLSAMRSGGLHHLGWGEDRTIASLTYDALALNTEASGNWRSKPPELPRYPRPDSSDLRQPEGKKAKRKATVAGIYSMFQS